MIEFRRNKKVKAGLNIAPLIDMVFLLLVFFMLSSHFISQPGIKITLPEAQTAKLHEEDIVVFIGEDSLIYLDGRELGFEELFAGLKDKFEAGGKRSVVIRADEKINLGLAVKIMDIARRAEAENLVISSRIENVER